MFFCMFWKQIDVKWIYKNHLDVAKEELYINIWCSVIQVQVQWPCPRVLPRSGPRPSLWEERAV